jgi:hypothetical protein
VIYVIKLSGFYMEYERAMNKTKLSHMSRHYNFHFIDEKTKT